MGALMERLWGSRKVPDGYDEPDPVTGLTPRERELVAETWKKITADVRNNGIRLFIKFFEAYPEYQRLFSAFDGVSLSDLPSNKKLLGHATTVLYAITAIVDHLHDADCLVELLQKTGRSHGKRNIKAHHFQNLVTVLISYLEDTLGPTVMNEAAKNAWQKTLDTATGIITKELDCK